MVFDFDGVVVDSEPMHERALSFAAAKLGLHFTPKMALARYVGLADRDAYRLICEDNKQTPSPEGFDELSAHKWKFAQAAIANGEVPAYPGTIALMHEAFDANYPLAICSGARRHEIVLMLERLNISHMLRFIVSADDVRHSKPHPEPYLATAALLGVHPSGCVTLEDTDKGIASAKAAGYYVIAVGHTLPLSRLTAADRFVKSSQEVRLMQLLSGQPTQQSAGPAAAACAQFSFPPASN